MNSRAPRSAAGIQPGASSPSSSPAGNADGGIKTSRPRTVSSGPRTVRSSGQVRSPSSKAVELALREVGEPDLLDGLAAVVQSADVLVFQHRRPVVIVEPRGVLGVHDDRVADAAVCAARLGCFEELDEDVGTPGLLAAPAPVEGLATLSREVQREDPGLVA